jgi:hypothetical protein
MRRVGHLAGLRKVWKDIEYLEADLLSGNTYLVKVHTKQYILTFHFGKPRKQNNGS